MQQSDWTANIIAAEQILASIGLQSTTYLTKCRNRATPIIDMHLNMTSNIYMLGPYSVITVEQEAHYISPLN